MTSCAMHFHSLSISCHACECEFVYAFMHADLFSRVYIHVYIHMLVCVCTYIYTYIKDLMRILEKVLRTFEFGKAFGFWVKSILEFEKPSLKIIDFGIIDFV